MGVSDSQDSLILPSRPNGGNHESTPDLVRLDTENLDDIIVSISRVVGLASSMEWKNFYSGCQPGDSSQYKQLTTDRAGEKKKHIE